MTAIRPVLASTFVLTGMPPIVTPAPATDHRGGHHQGR